MEEDKAHAQSYQIFIIYQIVKGYSLESSSLKMHKQSESSVPCHTI